MPKILIEADSVRLEAELNDSATADQVYQALPIAGRVNTWGDEIYFSIPVNAETEPNATDQLPAGSLAYWAPGNAFCIIWGPTPASHRDEPRFASAVNPLGKIIGDLSPLGQIGSGSRIEIRKADQRL